MSSLTALLKRPPASQLQGDFFGSSSRQGPCLAAAGLEQLKKTAGVPPHWMCAGMIAVVPSYFCGVFVKTTRQLQVLY